MFQLFFTLNNIIYLIHTLLLVSCALTFLLLFPFLLNSTSSSNSRLNPRFIKPFTRGPTSESFHFLWKSKLTTGCISDTWRGLCMSTTCYPRYYPSSSYTATILSLLIFQHAVTSRRALLERWDPLLLVCNAPDVEDNLIDQGTFSEALISKRSFHHEFPPDISLIPQNLIKEWKLWATLLLTKYVIRVPIENKLIYQNCNQF